MRRISLTEFKAARPAGYWEKASFKAPLEFVTRRCYEPYCFADYQLTSQPGRQPIVKTAFQAYLLGADYTPLHDFRAPKYRTTTQLPQRGLVRCDTFVYYAIEVSRQYAFISNPGMREWSGRIDALWGTSTPRGMHDMLKNFQ